MELVDKNTYYMNYKIISTNLKIFKYYYYKTQF